jgi:hypothetical protein
MSWVEIVPGGVLKKCYGMHKIMREIAYFLGRFFSKMAVFLWGIEVRVQAVALTLLRYANDEKKKLNRAAGASWGKDLHSVEEILSLEHCFSTPEVRMVDCKKIYWGYGYRLDSRHPLVLEIEYPNFLEIFFTYYQPKNFSQAWYPQYVGECTKPANRLVDIPKIDWYPWLLEKGALPRNDIANSGLGHGSQLRGPVTQINLRREIFRTKSLYWKILKEGYQPKNHGHIVGQFLEKKGEWIFVVLGGTHRLAILRALGYIKIPVMVPSSGPPPVVRYSSLRNEREKCVFDALFSTYGLEMRSKFIQKCLETYQARYPNRAKPA